MRQIYFYLNGTSDGEFPERELIQLDKAGYTVALHRVVLDTVPPYVTAEDRPVLSNLLRRVKAEDEVVVLQLSALGCSASDVLSTLLRCRRDGVVVRCVETGAVDLAGHPEPQAVKMLRAVVRMETVTRSERSRNGMRTARESGRPTGRPASLCANDREDVLRSLESGMSVSEVARRFSTSRQTVLRIRDSAVARERA